jgi:hypothetical protein
LDLFGGRSREFGDDSRSLGIGNQASQEAHFHVLTKNNDLPNETVRNVGLRFGGLISRISQRGGYVRFIRSNGSSCSDESAFTATEIDAAYNHVVDVHPE